MDKKRETGPAEGQKPQTCTQSGGDGEEQPIGPVSHIQKQCTVADEKKQNEESVGQGGEAACCPPQASQEVVNQTAEDA